MFNINKYVYSSECLMETEEKNLTETEQTIIIAMSSKCSLQEKIQDLQKIAANCDDMDFVVNINNLIRLWKVILNDRYNNTGVAFLAKLQERDSKNDSLSAYRFFSSYGTALGFLQKEKLSIAEVDVYGEIWRMELDTADPECDIYYFDNDMRLTNIVGCSNREELKDMKQFRYMQYEPDVDLDYSIKEELKKIVYR